MKTPTLPEILSKKDKDISANILKIRHILMKEYGWISDEEFRKIKIPILFGLLLEIQKEMREQENMMRDLRR